MSDKNKYGQPNGDRVLLRRVEADSVSQGGIVLPDTAKEKPQEAVVVVLGRGGRDANGNIIEFTAKEGDRVLISKYGGTEIKIEGEDFVILSQSDILHFLP